MTARSLFDPPDDIGKVRNDHPDTARAAAVAIAPTAATKPAQVLAYIVTSGGATDEEIQGGLRMAANTERPRRVELVEQKCIADSGLRRRGRSGRNAIVWTRAIVDTEAL